MASSMLSTDEVCKPSYYKSAVSPKPRVHRIDQVVA
jgi:hypothetical protein